MLFCVGLQVVFRDPVRYKLQKVLTVAAEGTYSGQVCWCIRVPSSQVLLVLTAAAAHGQELWQPAVTAVPQPGSCTSNTAATQQQQRSGSQAVAHQLRTFTRRGSVWVTIASAATCVLG
jgi:hypothetical protein